MNRLLRISFSVLFPLLLTGCFPERQTRVPEIKGLITRAGTPVAGVAVTLTREPNDCSKPIQRTSSGLDGRFSTSPIREFGISRIFTSPEQTYTVCLDTGSGPSVAWTQKSWGGPAPRTMTCDLAKPWESRDKQTCDQR